MPYASRSLRSNERLSTGNPNNCLRLERAGDADLDMAIAAPAQAQRLFVMDRFQRVTNNFNCFIPNLATIFCYSVYEWINSLPKYHRKRVGSYLASLTVSDMIQNGFTPYWDCEQSNEASNRLALRLGFEQVHQYRCFGFKL